MKVIKLFPILYLLICLFVTPPTQAQNTFPNIPDAPGFKYTNRPLGSLIADILPYAIGITGLAALIYILWAGFKLLISQGQAKYIEEARNQLVQGIVGFGIVFASYWIVQIVERVLGVGILR